MMTKLDRLRANVGKKCRINGKGDLAFWGEVKPFIANGTLMEIVKVTRAGLVQVKLHRDFYSVPPRNVDIVEGYWVTAEEAQQHRVLGAMMGHFFLKLRAMAIRARANGAAPLDAKLIEKLADLWHNVPLVLSEEDHSFDFDRFMTRTVKDFLSSEFNFSDEDTAADAYSFQREAKIALEEYGRMQDPFSSHQRRSGSIECYDQRCSQHSVHFEKEPGPYCVRPDECVLSPHHRVRQLGHIPIEPANQYCKKCGVALFTKGARLPCP